MATHMAFTASCHPPAGASLSKIASHLASPPGSQHDVGATRIGRRKAPAQFPFRSSHHTISLDDDSVWGIVLQRHPAPLFESLAYEAAWADAASATATNRSSGSSPTAEFSSSFSPEAITKECQLSTTPLSYFRHAASPPDPVPNPLSPEDHACIPVSWKGESRGKGVGVGDGSVCLLERNRSRNRGLDDLVAETSTVLPVTTMQVLDNHSCSDAEPMTKSTTKPKREFPGREFCNNEGDGRASEIETDQVFWKKSTTRKPAPEAAWDWDRMSRQPFHKEKILTTQKVVNEMCDEYCNGFEPAESVRGRDRILSPEAHATEDRYRGEKDGEQGQISDRTSLTGQRHRRAVQRLKCVIGHITETITVIDMEQEEIMKQAWDASKDCH